MNGRDGTNQRPSRERVAKNESHRCEVRGCYFPRYYTLRFCQKHRIRAKNYGNPTLTAIILKQDLQPFRREVQAVIRANSGHPGQIEALNRMRAILDPGAEPLSRNTYGPQADRRRRWTELTNLRKHGITPTEALEVACATWMLALERCPDGQSIAFAIARSIISLAPRPIVKSYYNPNVGKVCQSGAPLSAGAMRLVGTAIMENLVAYCTQVRLSCEASRQSMQQPLAPAQRQRQPRRWPKRGPYKKRRPKETPASTPTPAKPSVVYVPRRAPAEPIPEVPLDFFS